MKPVKCRRCGEVFKWALDLAAHTDTCPMPRVSHLDGSPGAETPLGEDASHQDASGRVTLPTEGTPEDAEAPPRSTQSDGSDGAS